MLRLPEYEAGVVVLDFFFSISCDTGNLWIVEDSTT